MFILYNTETEQFETFTTDELLEMINRDRSEDWELYDENSTIKEISEAIEWFCEPYSIEEDMPFATRG